MGQFICHLPLALPSYQLHTCNLKGTLRKPGMRIPAHTAYTAKPVPAAICKRPQPSTVFPCRAAAKSSGSSGSISARTKGFGKSKFGSRTQKDSTGARQRTLCISKKGCTNKRKAARVGHFTAKPCLAGVEFLVF